MVTAKLSGRYRYRDFSTGHTMDHRDMFIAIDEHPVTCLYHTQSMVTCGLTFGVPHSMGFEKCVITYIHHCSMTQNSFAINI